MAQTIIFLNQKGGVAKTTTTINVASQIAKMGHKTLMIDLDPQSSLSIISGFYDLSIFADTNIKELLQPTDPKNKVDINDCIFPVNCCDNLFLIPSDISLATSEMSLFLNLKGEETLKRIIKTVPSDFEYICVDCPPSFGMLSINAIIASDLIIGCTEPAYMSMRALKHMFDSIENISKIYERDFGEIGIVVGKIGRGNDTEDALEYLRTHYNVIGEIKNLVATSKGEIEGIPISIAKPSSLNAREFYKIAEQIVVKFDEKGQVS